MAKTLQNIIDEALPDATSLKQLKDAEAAAKKEYEDTPAEPEEAKKTKKAAYETAQKTFEKKNSELLSKIRNIINAELEKDNLAIYSKEVADRRKARKMSSIEDDITRTQGSIDILTLQIDAIDKEVEEVRKGLTPAKTT